MPSPKVTIRVARDMYHAGHSFRIRLENRTSRKAFWEVSYDGSSRSLLCNWGSLSTQGRVLSKQKTYDLSKALDKASDKLSGDYDYASGTATRTPPLTRPTPAPAPAPAPKPKLMGPYAMIREILVQRDGVCKAFDEQGQYLMALTREGADTLVDTDPFRISMRAA